MEMKSTLPFLLLILILPRRMLADQLHHSEYDSSTEQSSLEKDSNGGWSQWSEWSLCSRTCAGGVSRQLRSCNAPEGCGGEPVRYKICNMQPCNLDSNHSSSQTEDEWRASQCSGYDEVPYGGALYVWRPHKDDREPCSLTCRGTPKHQPVEHEDNVDSEEVEDDGSVIAVLADRVLDGTRCRHGSLDMCIDGRCQRVGCDLRVGSTKRVDECGVCGGDGNTCSKPRYRWMLSSSTACSATCGGGFKVTTWTCTDKLTGVAVVESLCDVTKKPTTNIVRCNTHACPYKWFVSVWTECSSSCGGGVRERRVVCARSENETRIGDNVYGADSEAAPCTNPPPTSTVPCNEHSCPEWTTENWSGCSVSCGSGIQVRGVECISHDGSGGCDLNQRPQAQRPCSTGIQCPMHEEEDDIDDLIPGVVYHTQPLIQQYPPPQARAERLTGDPDMPTEATFIKDAEWGPCSVSCGVGFRKREVHCKIFLEFSRTIATLPDSKCAGPKPREETERCDMGPCTLAYGFSFGDASEPSYVGDRDRLSYGITSNIKVAPGSPGKSYSWKEKGYTSCSASCLSGVQELIIQCVRDEDGKNASPYMCDPNTKPENRVRTCNDHPCPPRWNYTDFSACTKSCGIGIQTREVSCIHEVTRGGGNTVVVPNSMCPQPPPPDRQYCNVLDCPVRWDAGEWSKCSRTCGGGIKERKVECKQTMAQSHVIERPAEACGDPKPATKRECNTRPCANGIPPIIAHDNSSYIQHDPRKTKVTVKVGGSATLFSGTQAKIKCPVMGNNKTKVTWTKDGRRLEKSKKYKISKKGALRITTLTTRDAGVYACSAGGSKAELQLVVKARPGDFPSSEEVDRRAAPRTLHDPLADGRSDGRYRAVVSPGDTSDDQSHEQRPDAGSKKYKSGQKGKILKSQEMFTITTTQRSTLYRTNEDSPHMSRETADLPKARSSATRPKFDLIDSTFLGLGRTIIGLDPNIIDFVIPNFQVFFNLYEDSLAFINLKVLSVSREQRTIDQVKTEEILEKIAEEKLRNHIQVQNNTNINVVGEIEPHTEKSVIENYLLTIDNDRIEKYDELIERKFKQDNATEKDYELSLKIEDQTESLKRDQLDNKLNGIENKTKNTAKETDGVVVVPTDDEDDIVIVSEPDHDKLNKIDNEYRVENLEHRKSNRSDPMWLIGGWGHCCSPDTGLCLRHTCLPYGKGLQRRSVICSYGDFCSEPKPQSTKFCRTKPCQAFWKPGAWSKCTGHCINGKPQGWQHRTIECRIRHSKIQASGACKSLPRPDVARRCDATRHCAESCQDSSRFCANVRAMQLCYVRNYKQRCCRSCGYQ